MQTAEWRELSDGRIEGYVKRHDLWMEFVDVDEYNDYIQDES